MKALLDHHTIKLFSAEARVRPAARELVEMLPSAAKGNQLACQWHTTTSGRLACAWHLAQPMTTTPLRTRRTEAGALPSTVRSSVSRSSGQPDGTSHLALAGIVLGFVAAFMFLGYLAANLILPGAAHPRQSSHVQAVTAQPGAGAEQLSNWVIVIDADLAPFVETEDEGTVLGPGNPGI